MVDHPSLVRNAADAGQVKRARRIEESRSIRFHIAIREVLKTPAGRLVLSDILENAGIYRSVYDQSGSMMYFKEGSRNFGLELRALLERVDEDGVETMDIERRARRKADDREVEAGHVATAKAAGE